jgi:signal transduction histidine kinase
MPSVSPEKKSAKKNDLRQSRWLPVGAVLLALILLAGAISAGTWYLRNRLRVQAVNRDGEVLKAVAMMQFQAEQELDPQFTLAEPASQFQLLLKAAFLEGVMGARLYDAKGQFVTSFPENVREYRLNDADLGSALAAKSASRFYPAADLGQEFISRKTGEFEYKLVPLLKVTIPLKDKNGTQVFGAAQIILDGRKMAEEFMALDRTLVWQASLLFVVCGILMTVSLAWAFAHLARANEALAERSESLLKANQELALMARTSAVGAVAANLMHGLKSPLFGLINLFAAWRAADTVGEKVEWNTAVDTARHMQSMINGVMDFVRDQEGLANHEMSLLEMLDSVNAKVRPLAEQNNVGFERRCEVDAVVSARVGNLLTMILINLIQNAIEATPSGRQVRLFVKQVGHEMEFEVADEGGGLRPELEKQLFQPCESSKTGGSGLGLAICKQLARHLGAELTLRKNTANGCVFGLKLLPEMMVQQQLPG